MEPVKAGRFLTAGAAVLLIALGACGGSRTPTSSTFPSTTAASTVSTTGAPPVGDVSGTWRVFPGPRTASLDLEVDAEGFVWAGGQATVRIDPETLGYEIYGTEDGLPRGDAWSVQASPDGPVLVQTTRGLAEFVDGSFVEPGWLSEAPFDTGAPYMVADLAEIDDSGRVWFVARDVGAVFDGTAWAEFQIAPGFAGPVSGAGLLFSPSPDGSVWMWGGSRLYRWTGTELIDIGSPAAGTEMEWAFTAWDIAASVDGGVWVASTELYHYDGAEWTQIDAPYTRDLEVDAAGGLWMIGQASDDGASTGDVLFHLSGDTWEQYAIPRGVGSLVVRSPTDVWLSNFIAPELIRVHDGVVTTIRLPELDSPLDDVRWVTGDGAGNVYAVGDGDVWALDGEAWRAIAEAPPGLRLIAGDVGEGLWAASRRSLHHFASGHWEEADPPPGVDQWEGEITALTVSPDGLPVVASHAGLPAGPLTVSTWDGSSYSSIEIETSLLQLPSPIYHLGFGHGGDLWAATLAELVHIENGAASYVSKSDATAMILGIAVDRADSLWVAHSDGIARLRGGQWQDWAGGQDEVDIFEVIGVAAAPDGSVWMAGGGMLHRFDGAAWTDLETPLDLVHAVTVRPDGSVWLASGDRGIASWTPSP